MDAVTTRTLVSMASAQDGSRLIRCGAYSSLSRSKQDRLFADALRFLFSPRLS
jgi:hypothetical protein